MEALQRAAKALAMQVEVVPVRDADDLAGVQGLVLPGGESTTISRLLRYGRLQEPVRARGAAGDLALFGTCAGLILLSSRSLHDGPEKDVQLLGLLDTEVDRNAFGRQRDSFESGVEVAGLGRVPAVFIRAPVCTQAWGETEVLARTERGIIAVQKGRILGTAFHPELTPDTRLHERFLRLAAEAGSPPVA
jgi:pyridoxal 5'-phosphate synthase pdxT subunit